MNGAQPDAHRQDSANGHGRKKAATEQPPLEELPRRRV
jgi:hypothetical protein